MSPSQAADWAADHPQIDFREYVYEDGTVNSYILFTFCFHQIYFICFSRSVQTEKNFVLLVISNVGCEPTSPAFMGGMLELGVVLYLAVVA